jgi:hypothetical protein
MLPAEMAGILQGLKAGDALDMESFWPDDKFRIRADSASPKAGLSPGW